LKSPTTVEDACETKPVPKVPSPVNVDAPVTPSVEEKTFAPEKVFTSASKVDEAAVMVIDPPRESDVPLIVPNTPVMNPDPTDVVDTSLPFSSVARSADVREEKY